MAIGGTSGVAVASARCTVSGVVVLLLWSGLLMPLPEAGASESGEVNEEQATIRRIDPDLVTPGPSGNHLIAQRALWFWERGGRILTVTDMTANQDRFMALRAYDSTTFAEVGKLQFTNVNAIWASGQDQLATSGQPHTVAVDDEGGRAFALATHFRSALHADEWAPDYPRQGSCAWVEGQSKAPCFTGVHVVDLASLDLVRTIRLGAVRADGVVVSPVPRALTYAPPRHPGEKGKILMLVEEFAGEVGASAQPQLRPRGMSLNTAFAIQLDPDTGQRDWTVRLEACHAPREKSNPDNTWNRRPHPAAIFRTADLIDPSIWVGCHSGTSNLGTAVRLPLGDDGVPMALVRADADPEPQLVLPSAGADSPVQPESASELIRAPEVVVGPELVAEILADPQSERMVMRTLQRSGEEVWTVFDGRRREFLGRVGTGNFPDIAMAVAGLDPATGRLYVLHGGDEGGIFVADIRRTPVPQALRFPEFAALHPTTGVYGHYPLIVQSANELGRPARIFIPEQISTGTKQVRFRVLEDQLPVSVDADSDLARRSVDIEERSGLTSASFDGAARGFGARAILLAGVDGAARAGLVDSVGVARGAHATAKTVTDGRPQTNGLVPPPEQCTPEDREVVVGFVGPDGPAIVDTTGARGGAVPLLIDGRTANDLRAPVSRCDLAQWEALWSKGLFGRPPIEEPGASGAVDWGIAECVSSGQADSAKVGDPVLRTFAAEVACDEDTAAGHGYFRGLQVGDVRVGEALSSFRIYRDPYRGVVSRVESVARGIAFGPALRIETVRGSAESWANGRRQPVPDERRESGYESNCDFERTAGTCFQRHLFGVWTPEWSCGPCGDETAFVKGTNAAMGANGRVRLREPDPALARGSDDGFLAAAQKPDGQRFADLTLNNDLLQTVVPVLEIVRYSAPWRWSDLLSYQDRPGRQIYQFAGVEVSSSYGIQCLLVYDEETNTCAEDAEPPGSLTVTLADEGGKPLAGGAFEVRSDVDGDGLVGLVDTLIPDGACITAENGIGNCQFDGLAPGTYLITQVAAPPGYGKVDDPWVSEVASGEARTVAFTNSANVSVIDVKAADEDGKPISGATFAVYADPDADGKIAADATLVAQCTTGDDGTCQMQVPAGSYVLVQTDAPAGVEGIEPIAFAFASGGQTAAVGVTNYPVERVPEVPAASAPVYTAPAVYVPPVETVGDYAVRDDQQPQVSLPERVGGTVAKVIQAPGDVLRLLTRDPQAAAAFAATLLLFVLAAGAMRRRGMLEQLTR